MSRDESRDAARIFLRLLERMGTMADIPIGACPRHPDGCGRSGKAWDAIRDRRA